MQDELNQWKSSFAEVMEKVTELAKLDNFKELAKQQKEKKEKIRTFEDGRLQVQEAISCLHLQQLTKDAKKALRECDLTPSECEKNWDILLNCLWAATKLPPTEELRLKYRESKKEKKEKKKDQKQIKKEEAIRILDQLLDERAIALDNPERWYSGKKELDKG